MITYTISEELSLIVYLYSSFVQNQVYNLLSTVHFVFNKAGSFGIILKWVL